MSHSASPNDTTPLSSTLEWNSSRATSRRPRRRWCERLKTPPAPLASRGCSRPTPPPSVSAGVTPPPPPAPSSSVSVTPPSSPPPGVAAMLGVGVVDSKLGWVGCSASSRDSEARAPATSTHSW